MTAELQSVTDDRGETLAARWEPELQFVGALLWQSAAAAAPLLEAVPHDAITDPLTRWAYELIAGLVTEARDPHPPAVLHRAKSRPAVGALRPDRAPTRREYHRLAMHLADLYTQVLDPNAVTDHANDVLDEAYRRTVHAAGCRLQVLADTCADVTELAAAVAATCAGTIHRDAVRLPSRPR